MSTVEVTPGGPRPSIRVRPAPRLDPPYDDELEPDYWVTAHQLAFEWPRMPVPPFAEPAFTEPFGTSPWPHPGAGRPDPPQPDPRCRQPSGTTGEAKLAVRRFVQMCVEVLNGYRPAAHLRSLTLPTVAADIVAQAVAGVSRVAEIRRAATTTPRSSPGIRAGRSALATGATPTAHGTSSVTPSPPALPSRSAPAGRTPLAATQPAPAAARRASVGRGRDRHDRHPRPVGVLSSHLCEPRPGAVEAAVTLVTAGRTWAMALRLEVHNESWRATTMRLI